MKTTVYLAEDDPMLRDLFLEALALRGELELVGMTGSGREVAGAVARLRPDLLLLDVHLPDLSGLEVLDQLSLLEERPKVLVLSGDEDEAVQLRAAQGGAQGFVRKAEALQELWRAIEAVARGEPWFRPEIIARALSAYPAMLRAARGTRRPLDLLTEREREVLLEVARGLTNQQVAAQLHISLSTVKVHIGSIFEKLNLQSRTEAAVLAVREGLLDAAPTADG
jgi:DNA-binding NarL/FixJ family response regulator